MKVSDILKRIKNKDGQYSEKQIAELIRRDDEWRKEVVSRYYEKEALVHFVQYGHDKNEKDTYFMCGYLNVDGNKFRDLATGDIYEIFDAPYIDKESEYGEQLLPTISVGNNSFVKIEPRVDEWEEEGNLKVRHVEIGMNGTALFPFDMEGESGLECVMIDSARRNGRYTKWLNLYKLLDQNVDGGVVSGINVLLAIEEANDACREAVKQVALQRSREGGEINQGEIGSSRVGFRPEELDF